MNKKIIITAVLTIVVGLGTGFFAGMKYQQNQRPNFGTGQFNNRMMGSGNGNATTGRGNGFRPYAGEVVSMDDKSITIKLTDGGSKIILLSDKTTIAKTDSATKADLKAGVKISVFGTANSDGSVTAGNVQINPIR